MGSASRDRFIMSKGHSVPAQHVALSMLGIIAKEELKSLKQMGSPLQGHPDMRKTPGIEAPTGSLGMGLSFANGLSLAARLDEMKFNIFLLLADQVEAPAAADRRRLLAGHAPRVDQCHFGGDRNNEVGGPLKETMTASCYVSLINYRGPGGTVTLLDVLAYDRRMLRSAAGH